MINEREGIQRDRKKKGGESEREEGERDRKKKEKV